MTSDEQERVSQLLANTPHTWQEWAEPLENTALPPMGRDLMAWATEVVASFYGDDWFGRDVDGASNPLFSMYDLPYLNHIGSVRHVERAARISLLEGGVREILTEGANGIRASDKESDFEHLGLVLETLGLALRDGWSVEVEIATAHGSLPDIRLTRTGFSYLLEVTIQGVDRDFHQTQRQSDLLQIHQFRIESKYGVDCVTRFTSVVPMPQFDAYVTELERAAESVSRSRVAVISTSALGQPRSTLRASGQTGPLTRARS